MSNDEAPQPQFTYLVDGKTVTTNVADLVSDQTYHFECKCGCGETFTQTGKQIRANPVLTKYISESPIAAPVQTSWSTTTTSSNIVASNFIVMNEMDTQEIDVSEFATNSPEEPQTEEIEVVEKRPSEPVIGDIVWSKATRRGPFVIIAGTSIGVRAAKLEINTAVDGVYIQERARADQLLSMDAWLVRDTSGRVTSFPKAELTTEPQFHSLSLVKVLAWIATFSAFVVTGWFLHR